MKHDIRKESIPSGTHLSIGLEKLLPLGTGNVKRSSFFVFPNF